MTAHNLKIWKISKPDSSERCWDSLVNVYSKWDPALLLNVSGIVHFEVISNFLTIEKRLFSQKFNFDFVKHDGEPLNSTVVGRTKVG